MFLLSVPRSIGSAITLRYGSCRPPPSDCEPPHAHQSMCRCSSHLDDRPLLHDRLLEGLVHVQAAKEGVGLLHGRLQRGHLEGLKFGRSAKRLFCLALESHSNRMLRSEFCTLISLLASTVPSRTQSSKLRAKLASLETTPRAGHLKARPCLRVSATLRC
jgi:hypothetical protein